jgi:hypothetical protein
MSGLKVVKLRVKPASMNKQLNTYNKQKTTEFSTLKNMTLKSKSKNWNLPHNKYSYPNIPIS